MRTMTTHHQISQLLSLEDMVRHWQQMVDSLASQAEVPCALINRMDGSQLVVDVTNSNGKHPFFSGQQVPLHLNSYCATVLRTQQALHVADATQLPEMHDNPTAALGLVFYHGYPLYWPDGHLFGTICILDYFNRPMDEHHAQLLQLLKSAIEADLARLDQNTELQQQLEQEQNSPHSLPQSHYNSPQSVDLLANLTQMLHQHQQLCMQQLQSIDSQLELPEHQPTTSLIKPGLQQLQQQMRCWSALSEMLQNQTGTKAHQREGVALLDIAERGAYQAAILLKASPRITTGKALNRNLAATPAPLELLCCAIGCYLISNSLSRLPDLHISEHDSDSELQLIWQLLFPWSEHSIKDQPGTEPFWIFSQYLATLLGLEMQHQLDPQKLEIRLIRIMSAT